MFSINNGTAKETFKSNEKKKKRQKHNEFVLLARSKLESIENIISKTLFVNKIIHEDFTTITNEAESSHKLKTEE